MKYIKDEPYADLFLCDGDLNFHEYYYIEETPAPADSLLYRISRTGIEVATPALFHVERSSSTPWCEIFSIFSGQGSLYFRGKLYRLKRGHLVVLPAGEAHVYESDPSDPLGMTWLEFYGADAPRIMTHVVNTQGCVLEGSVYADVTAALSRMQQRLMVEKKDRISVEIYELLHFLLINEERLHAQGLSDEVRSNLLRAEAYIEAHLGEGLSNEVLARLIGLSPSYFLTQFRQVYHQTPHQYVLQRRIARGRSMLIQSSLSVDEIAAYLGFCSASHFIRQFKAQEKMSPAQYRREFRL